jgi:hypothetical protein
LISGCFSGIGRTTALYLAQNDFTVFASVRKEKDRHALLQLNQPNLIPVCPLGLQTPSEAEPLSRHPRGDLYRARLGKWLDEMVGFDQKRTEPEKVARVVMGALRVPKPKRSYSVGYMSGAAAFLEALPLGLVDTILKARS